MASNGSGGENVEATHPCFQPTVDKPSDKNLLGEEDNQYLKVGTNGDNFKRPLL